MLKFNTIGGIVEVLREYDFKVGEDCTIVDMSVFMYGEKIANIEYEDLSGFPIFYFNDRYDYLNDIQIEKRWDALQRLFGYPTNAYIDKDQYFLGKITYRGLFLDKEITSEAVFDINHMMIMIFNDFAQMIGKFNFYGRNRYEPEEELRKRAWAIMKTRKRPS